MTRLDYQIRKLEGIAIKIPSVKARQNLRRIRDLQDINDVAETRWRQALYSGNQIDEARIQRLEEEMVGKVREWLAEYDELNGRPGTNAKRRSRNRKYEQ